jgi:bifunctional non-homologous end joining protein LigD
VFSRTGHEWGAQLPAIAATLRTLPVRSVILDGEGVIWGPDGAPDFDRMRAVFSRKGSPDVFLYAFDVLELDGCDLRAQSWDARRALLTQLLDRCDGRNVRMDLRWGGGDSNRIRALVQELVGS